LSISNFQSTTVMLRYIKGLWEKFFSVKPSEPKPIKVFQEGEKLYYKGEIVYFYATVEGYLGNLNRFDSNSNMVVVANRPNWHYQSEHKIIKTDMLLTESEYRKDKISKILK
jgi:hypothetical protein